ncbi:3D domain-containing protein [Thiofilum flexile]|uniref:3D domain-containing protein n=1 Tax=Thiofilum flexile TaxID=125627 RepID=UPI00036ADE36|nr:3D domain-containing protein [Thiofilum flexile]
MSYKILGLVLVILFNTSFVMAAGTAHKKIQDTKSLQVKATAYTSLNLPKRMLTAWGVHLQPGMKAIAVSRDLLTKFGLKPHSKVKISGFEGEYVVLDKMHRRWEKKIDIYMGNDHSKALRFGRRNVTITWGL